jgi:membrane protein
LFLEAATGFVATFAFFWWSMHFLLAGNAPWVRLWFPAAVTAGFWLALEGFGALYFSSTITSDSRVYGTIGVVFSLLTWFIAIAAVILIGAVSGEVWQKRR